MTYISSQSLPSNIGHIWVRLQISYKDVLQIPSLLR